MSPQGLRKILRLGRLVVVDVETTGLSANSGDEIIEIGAVKLGDQGVIEEFHSLVNPCRPVSHGAFLVNGIPPESLASAPVISDVFPEFFEFIQGCTLVAHNASFDLSFLNMASMNLTGEKLTNPVVDTLALSRTVLPGLYSHSLPNLAWYFNLEPACLHRGLEDARTCARIFLCLLEKLKPP